MTSLFYFFFSHMMNWLTFIYSYRLESLVYFIFKTFKEFFKKKDYLVFLKETKVYLGVLVIEQFILSFLYTMHILIKFMYGLINMNKN